MVDNLPDVLIVEDKIEHARLIGDYLKDHEYKIEQVNNFKDTMDFLNGFHKDREKSDSGEPRLIVLIDVQIPIKDKEKIDKNGGIKLLDEIRSHYPNLPVVFVSAWGKEAYVEEAAKKYKVPVVSKPIDMERLIQEVRRVSR